MSRGWSLLAALLAAIALVAGGYVWGDRACDNAWQAKEAKRLQDEQIAQRTEQLRAEKASGAVQAQLLQQSIANDQLQGAFNAYKRKHPILAAPANVPAADGASGAQAADTQQRAGPGEPSLSLGAVWMWNSALFGRDAPAGACGLADSTEGACAAGSGISLEDAWDNQAINARICAEDRLRHQRLIDYLKDRKQ